MQPAHQPPASSSERLALLFRLSQALNSSLDLNEVLNRMMDEVISTMQAERGFVMLADPTTSQPRCSLDIQVARGIDQHTVDAPEFQISRSVIEQVCQTGKPILTNDAQLDDRFSSRQSVRILGLRSILCVPLMVKEVTTGVVYVDNRIQAGIFTQADLELLSVIAGNAAVAIENARLYQAAQTQLARLRLLHDISADLTSTLDLERVLTACLQRVQDIFNAQAASILTVEGEELVFQVALGEQAAAIRPVRIPVGQGIAGWVVAHRESALVNDVHNDPRFYAQTDTDTGFLTQCILAAPLIVNERAVGVVEVFNKPGGFTHADLDVLATIASSAAIAIENARLYQAAVEKGRMEREMQVASQVQASLLPDDHPHLPGWEFAACWLPARDVAGDYYDFIQLSNGKQGMVIADVTDKGMPAALFMAFTRSVVRASMDEAATPLQGIRHANRLICTDSSYGFFVTLFYAALNPLTCQLTYVNAGHNPPLFFRSRDDQFIPLHATGMPLGIEVDTPYQENILTFEPGDFLVCYTDGVTEANDAAGSQYGMQRLEAVIREHHTHNAEQLVESILQSVRQYTAEAAPFDDITLLVVCKT